MLRWAVDNEAVRRWIAGQRAAEQRSFERMRTEGPMSPQDSFAAAMELCALAEVPDRDPVRDREIAEARALWAKLKRKWAENHG